MKLASANQIKEIDFLSTSRYQIPSKIRMEIAGLKSFEIIKKEYKQDGEPQKKWNQIMSIYNKSRCNESLHLKNGRCN